MVRLHYYRTTLLPVRWVLAVLLHTDATFAIGNIMNKLTDTKGRWIFGSLTVLLMLPVVFIIGLLVGINIESSIKLSQDNLSSWVSAFATVIIAFLTIVLAKETWGLRLIQLSQIEQIRKDSLKPSVSLFLKSSPEGFNFIDIHVSNNGPGTAQNVEFKFINRSKDTVEVYEHLLNDLNRLAILEKGISSLSANEQRSSYLFSFIDFHNKFKEKALECVIEVEITFEDIEGSKYLSKSFFNFNEYKGISSLGGDPLREIASNIEKIQKDIGHFATGFRKIKADVYTSEDRKVERENWEKRRAEHLQDQADNS